MRNIISCPAMNLTKLELSLSQIPVCRDSGPIFFLFLTILIGIYEYSALNSELNGLCSVQNGQLEAEISLCKARRDRSIFLPNSRTKCGTFAHAQIRIPVKNT